MIALLLVLHVVVGAAIVLTQNRPGFFPKVVSFPTAIVIGFLYVSVVQPIDAVLDGTHFPTDVEVALWVSWLSLVSFGFGNRIVPILLQFRPRHRKQIDTTKLLLPALGLISLGVAGFAVFVSVLGGFSALLGLTEPAANPFRRLSGYVYNLPLLAYAGIGLLSIRYATGRATKTERYGLFAVASFFFLVALNSTDRSDILRALLPVVVADVARDRSRTPGERVWGRAVRLWVLVMLVASVLLLPHFRDTGRRLFTSEMHLEAAVSEVVANRASSRFSERRGGEFDGAVRIVTAVQNGTISPPGPLHVAYFVWGFIPRHLYPEKHEVFDRWAGPARRMILSEASYQGAALTGWGEAIGYMGLGGALLYWILLGAAVAKFEYWLGDPVLVMVFGASAFLPLAQLVVMGFWSGMMNMVYVVLPMVVVVSWAMRAGRTRAAMTV